MAEPANSRYPGLSALQARELLLQGGPNELPRPERRTPYRIALEVLREPMLAMLLAAGLIYLLLGDTSEALILIFFAGFSIVVTIIQEARTENVLDALRGLAAPRALVIRDGETMRIPGREVVPGDILLVEQGDRVAADAQLLECRDLEADEALLTGESVPVSKRPASAPHKHTDATVWVDSEAVFSGSIITRGSGVARVVATGLRSRIGRIGHSLATLETETPRLQQATGRVVRLCAGGGVAVAIAVILLYGLRRGGWLDAVLAGIATGMSLLPEEFPVVLTIFLAMGAWRIAQTGVLTRRTSAIEAMGAATILCTDKTGTLTQNRMSVAEMWLPSGDYARSLDGRLDPRFHALLEAGLLASAPVAIDPMEIAFHEAARPLQFGKSQRKLVHTHALSPELLAMSNVWQPEESGVPLTVAAKGAPEAIAELCRLSPEARSALDGAAVSMAEHGMRVLGVAVAAPEARHATRDHREHQFTLAGLVGLADPLRSGVNEAVAQCRAAGIRVVMITGDYAATAKAIAAQAGIAEGELMTGSDVAALSDAELAARVANVSIFARTMPEQKLRIVLALKARGEVVAMTGDGVNDAPALKAADIGVAMGRRGTDVAREAAAIVLVEDDFGAIVAAIRVGRRIYDNIRKAVSFIFAVHVPIAVLALLPLLLGFPVIFGPIQIALLEMIIDPVCALVFEAEREERTLMHRPPRSPREPLFALGLVARGVSQGTIALVVLATAHLLTTKIGWDAAQTRTFIFFALVAGILALVLANRSFSVAMSQAVLRDNRTFRVVLLFIGLASALILTVRPVQNLLQFAPLGGTALAIIALIGATLLFLFELTKRASFRPD